MPLLTLHLLRLDPSVEIPKFLRAFGDEPNVELVVASQPRHPVIRPTRVDADQLMSKPWDLMVLIRSPANALPTSLRSAVREEYKLDVGISSKLLSHYRQHDQGLKDKAARVPLSGALEKAQARPSSQNLELSPDLIAFMEELSKDYDKPVTMLNLLSFQEGGKPKYYQYGQGFIEVAGRIGGDPKIVGNVINHTPDPRGEAKSSRDEWNEISIVHYPTIKHFCDMLAMEDYQAINEKHRLGALKDTLLLCTTEYDLDKLRRKSKL